MAAVRGRDTKPELTLRKALHARGLRYRTHTSAVLGRPDLVNRARKVAIFVDGDYWHGNPDEWRRRGYDSLEAQFAINKRAFWTEKITGNIRRDQEVTHTLTAEGWCVIRVWESDIRADLNAVIDRVITAWQ
jgi:DNA mismatch endonuclease (patch repair protein)